MPDAPRFSVTIPAYNAQATLVQTVESVLAQSFRDFEVVICDDGSTDATLAIAQQMAAQDSRVRVVSQENRGSGGAYNTAVRASRAGLIVMLSADDLLLPDHLEAFEEFIQVNPDAAVFTCDGWFEYEDGRTEPQDLNRPWRDPAECTLEELLPACFYGIGAVYRREVFDTVGGFKEDIYAEDFLFWMLALAHGFRHRYLDRPLSVHRRSAVQKSADALRVRQADISAVQEVVATGLLTPQQQEVAQRTIAQLERNVKIRSLLNRVVGPERATRLIARLRGRRAPQSAQDREGDRG